MTRRSPTGRRAVSRSTTTTPTSATSRGQGVPGLGLAAARNLAKAWLVVLLLAALFAGLGWLIGGARAASLFAFCSLLAALAVWWAGDRALLGMLGARPFALAESPILKSRVDRLAAVTLVLPPKLYLIDDPYPRIFAVGRGPRSATVAVSAGLLSMPSRELDALLAHELAHVRTRDVLTQTFAVLLALTFVETSRVGGWLSRALLFVLAPVAAAFTHLLLSPRRELLADRLAAAATGDPDALADALVRLDLGVSLVEFVGSPATEPLYPVDLFSADDRLARMFETHPPLEKRLEALRALTR